MGANTSLEAMTEELLQKMPSGAGFKATLDAVATGLAQQLPVEFEKGEAFMMGLGNSDQFKAALKPGDKFPAFELPGARGIGAKRCLARHGAAVAYLLSRRVVPLLQPCAQGLAGSDPCNRRGGWARKHKSR
jgi:hypothetical protein